ncbi:MAG: amidase [Desulfuromonadales bacterium]|nr:amidase [Desulfuromonadales bacterium]
MRTKGKFILCTADEFEGWLASASINRTIGLLQNHHTFLPAYKQFNGSNHFELLEGMEHFHVVERGFEMIAQNLTTFPDGTVAVCRPLDRIPAGIKGANKVGVCIENLGNFDAGGDVMANSHNNTIVRVNASLCRRFGLIPTTETIVYHHWYDLDSGSRTNGTGNTKTCPGTAFFGGNTVAAAQANFIPLVLQYVTPSSVPASPLRSAEVSVDSLNVRDGAGMQYAIVKKVHRGVVLQVYEETAGWYRIAPDRQEWVFGQYVQTDI